MIKGLVTIVIPIYNVEKYLDRCINSVVNQTYKNLEVILVDDGSPDKCPQMCEEWAKKDSRIEVIHKENAGLGMARNTGIENARGEYIFFFDSDDYVALDTVEKVFQVAERTNAELIMFGHQDVDKKGYVKKISVPQTDKEYYKNEEVQKIILPAMVAPSTQEGALKNLGMSACMSAYKYSLIHRTNFRFVSEREIVSEDVYSLLCLMKEIQSIAVIPEAFYYYCENSNSLTHTYQSDHYLRIKEFYKECIEKCDELGYEPVVKERFAYVYMANTIAVLKLIAKSDLPAKKRRRNVTEIINDELMQQIVHQVNIRNQGILRMLLFLAIRNRWAGAVYWMVKAKT